MKKIITVILMLIVAVPCEGAVSGDMSEYVRKDVYEVRMQGINAKLDQILEVQKELRDELKSQRKDINALTNTVSALTARVDGLDARMGDIRNDIYLVLVILGILVGVPSVQKWYERLKASRPSVTLEEVKRLIEENNAELLKSLKS